jgi:thiol:disulfide interchange protein
MTRMRLLLPLLGLAVAVASIPGVAGAAASKYSNLDEALAAGRDLQKPVLIDFFAQW